MERSTETVGASSAGLAGAGCAAHALAGGPWWLWVAGVPLLGFAVAAFAASPPLGRRASGVTRTSVVVGVVVALVGPWAVATQPVGRVPDPVLDAGMPEGVRAVGGRLLVDVPSEDDTYLVSPAGPRMLASDGFERHTASSSAGWVFVSDDGDGGLTGFGAGGERLFEVGGDDSADPEVRVVAADERTAVLLSCADDGLGTCTVTSVDRAGRIGWARRLGPRWQSSVPEESDRGTGADVPDDDRLWLVRPTQDFPGEERQPARAVRLDPTDGSVVDRRDDAAVVRVGSAPRLEVSSPDGRCRTSAWRGGDRLWMRDLGADACPDVYATFALGPTAYVGGEVPIDLRTGRVLDRLDARRFGGTQPDLIAGADPVAVRGSRGWVLDAATGRVRWRFDGIDDGVDAAEDDGGNAGSVEVVSSATTLAVVCTTT